MHCSKLYKYMLDVALCLVLGFAFLMGARADDHGSETPSYDADSFKAGVEAKRHFVMFFAPWCGHCKNLAPTWNELAKVYNREEDESPVTVAKVDCTEHTALCADHEVTGFPTLKLFEKGGKTFKRYSGKRDLESLKNFVQENVLGTDAKADEAVAEPKEEDVVVLDDENFDEKVAKGNFFIKFFAPWCGHCKKLAPTWDELAESLAGSDTASIGKIDCTQSSVICKKYEVRGYPTLLWFQDGEKIAKYQSSRSLEALREYVIKQAAAAKQTAGSEDAKDEGEEEDAKPVGAEGEVVELTEDNFKSFLSTRLVFVKFFAPWCGHCKRLAPTWEDLAKNVEGEKVSIARVDCTQYKTVCDWHEVRGYPTLKIFRNGEFVKDYRGARTLEDLKQFAESHIDDAQKDEL